MARAARMALDAALLSIEKVRPVISSVWGSTKSIVTKTPAKPLVRNSIIEKVEGFLENMTDTLVTKMAWMRDQQLPGELRYLEKELEKTRRRMGSQGNSTYASKTLKPELSIAWQYCKIECAPPMTVAFFAGSGGAKIEQVVGGAVNSFIGNLESTIRKIDEDEARAKKEKEENIRKEQAAKKAEEAKKAKEKEVAAKQKEAEAKKTEPKPAEKKPPPTRKQPQAEAKKQSAPTAAAKKEPPKTPPKTAHKKEDPKKKK